jgi:ribosomal protein S26
MMPHGKKWGLYKAGGRSQPVECTFCGRLVPRVKAIPVHRKFGLDKIPGVDLKQVYVPDRKGYACISCAKHRKMI